MGPGVRISHSPHYLFIHLSTNLKMIKTYTPETINEVGLTVKSETLNLSSGNKLYVNVVDGLNNVHKIYLAKNLYAHYELKTQPLPIDLVFFKSCPEHNDSYFVLIKDRKKKKRILYDAPTKTGDSIKLKNDITEYLVLKVSKESIIVSSKQMFIDYFDRKSKGYYKVVKWVDFEVVL